MQEPKPALSIKTIQWILWPMLFVIYVLSLLPYDSFLQSISYGFINIGSYFITVYINAYLLIPGLYERGRRFWYVIASLVFISATGAGKAFLSFYVYKTFFSTKPAVFYLSSVSSSIIIIIIIYFSGILFYIALNFFKLRRKQEELQKRHAEAELNLLKAQVQPHFLFNTLNNIYFVAQRESPATALLLERLSLIMRYFVDEAPKERIGLSIELDFIKSYLELEKMRMRYPLLVTIQETGITELVYVPPMLLVPLVENVFKHGIDKRRNDNFIFLSVTVENSQLTVIVENLLLAPVDGSIKSELGLKNLKSRLDLLYGEACLLKAGVKGNLYQAQLIIPL